MAANRVNAIDTCQSSPLGNCLDAGKNTMIVGIDRLGILPTATPVRVFGNIVEASGTRCSKTIAMQGTLNLRSDLQLNGPGNLRKLVFGKADASRIVFRVSFGSLLKSCDSEF
jgi:hypothetical protein